MGLRSLAQGERGYIDRFGEDAQQRMMTYHQGAVWSWLIGPFVSAHLRVYQDALQAQRFLEPFLEHLSEGGLGSISELYDAVPPFISHGCFAQAWSVAEILRVWQEIQENAPGGKV
jgi:glycogen debranching enzyme